MRRAFLIGACLLTLVSCSSKGNEVDMPTAHSFSPKTITIQVGETVTWKNSSSEQHTVTADEESLPDGAKYWASGDAASEEEANDDLGAGLLGPGESYASSFETPGRYSYYCILHRSDGMEGTVIVED